MQSRYNARRSRAIAEKLVCNSSSIRFVLKLVVATKNIENILFLQNVCACVQHIIRISRVRNINNNNSTDLNYTLSASL